MRPPVRHLLWVLLGFCLAAIPADGVRIKVAQIYAQSSNTLVFDQSELGRGGQLSLKADTEVQEGTMSQDAALILGTRRKPQAVVFGVNIRRDAFLPWALAVLTALCAPTTWSRRFGAAFLAGGAMYGLSLLSFRAIAAWYFLVHGSSLMVYLPDPELSKVAKVLYKAVLSQPNYRLALGAAVGAGSLWLLGYHPLRGVHAKVAPMLRWRHRG